MRGFALGLGPGGRLGWAVIWGSFSLVVSVLRVISDVSTQVGKRSLVSGRIAIRLILFFP